jgi:CheY-like chemotaxis protein
MNQVSLKKLVKAIEAELHRTFGGKSRFDITHKSTILIVDDEAVGRETLEALLIAQGYNLAFASSGPEALEKAAELALDLILLDVMMPGMDLPLETVRRQIGSAIHMIVQVARMRDGSRKVTHITEILGMEGKNVIL